MYVKTPRVDTDSDYAGCVLTRKAGSWTQGTRSLSVAESESYERAKGGSFLLRAKSMMIYLNQNVVQCDLGTSW